VGFVGQHDAPEVCGEVSFERAGGVARWFALSDSLGVVRAAVLAGIWIWIIAML
jgi:hypothetical protein